MDEETQTTYDDNYRSLADDRDRYLPENDAIMETDNDGKHHKEVKHNPNKPGQKKSYFRDPPL